MIMSSIDFVDLTRLNEFLVLVLCICMSDVFLVSFTHSRRDSERC